MTGTVIEAYGLSNPLFGPSFQPNEWFLLPQRKTSLQKGVVSHRRRPTGDLRPLAKKPGALARFLESRE